MMKNVELDDMQLIVLAHAYSNKVTSSPCMLYGRHDDFFLATLRLGLLGLIRSDTPYILEIKPKGVKLIERLMRKEGQRIFDLLRDE